MGQHIPRGYGVWVGRSQIKRMEAAAEEANGTTREALKGNKSGWYLPRNPAEDVNPWSPAHLGLGGAWRGPTWVTQSLEPCV